MTRRTRISLSKGAVLTARKAAATKSRLVYLLVVNKRLSYGRNKSRIAYIGTTMRGLKRVAESVAFRGKQAFKKLRGVRSIEAHLLIAKGRSGTQMWRELERSALLAFKLVYGHLPKLNTHGKGLGYDDQSKFFNQRTLIQKLRKFEQ